MKKLIMTLIFLHILIYQCISQQWQYIEDFIVKDSGPHGIVVTPDNKIWVGYWYDSDSIHVGGGVYLPTRPLWVYNPDGSLHQKIQFLTFSGTTDTLTYGCRGLSLDNNGNVLYPIFNTLWRINYQSYQAENKLILPDGKSPTKAACDANGFIYITYIVPSNLPIYIYDSNFQLFNTVINNSYSISRNLVVSQNGNDVYLGRIYGGAAGNGIIHYHSDNGPIGPYTVIDTLHKNIWAGSSLDFDKNGFIWAGSYWDVGPNELNGWYKLDPNQNCAIVDSIGQNAGTPVSGPIPPQGGTFYAPRGAAWNQSNSVMYTADFDGDVIKKWINTSNPIPELYISVPIVDGYVNDTILVPLEVSCPLDSSYNSLEINLSGFQDRIQFLSIQTDSSLAGNAGWTFQLNNADSLLRIAAAGSNAISGSGNIFWLEFAIPDSADTGFVPINIDSATFNTGNLTPIISSGGINIITLLIYGDVNLDGVVWYNDCDTLMNYLVNKTSLNALQMQQANVTPDTIVSSLDAFYIWQYVNQWVPSLPVNSIFPASADFIGYNYYVSIGDTVDVTFSFLNNQDMVSFYGEIEYQVSGLNLLDVIWSPVILDTFRLAYNSNLHNKVAFAGFSWGGSPIYSGLITLRFQIANNYNSDSAFVVLTNVRLNESPVLQNAAVSTLHLITGISDEDNIIPNEFSLSQNYPNPFNPSTSIRFGLPYNSNISIKVFNLLGQEVSTIVDKYESAGWYTLKWNGKSRSGEKLSSGIYIIQMEAANFISHKKALLLK